ncbi:UbiX family flavin prenyltransferase [Taibaiella koreensis]|uniref:UbiX family flavin prenyltransferase n=1 Tax=Taibaiella koreensis TaxID=1268548 RepID=UPI000E59B3E3|nr:UbiX family flavin prenyltransferase [Taibaiella koreensis]
MKIAVAITGASGSIYVQQLLYKLARLEDQITEVGIVWSDNAKTVWEEELGNKDYDQFPFKVWAKNDFYAPFASGSADYQALIICPCSMGTLGRIAGGISDNLITRAADVMLKERRKLICMIREMPYSLVHINNMKTVTEAGGIICPASPSFYHKPHTLEEATQTVVDRLINLAGLRAGGFRWGQ